MSAVILPFRRRDPHISYAIGDKIRVTLVDGPAHVGDLLDQTFPLCEAEAAQAWVGTLQAQFGFVARFRSAVA
jgi:hypothetical protein